LLEPPLDELALKIGQAGPEQPAITMDVVAMGAHAREIFVDHRRHP
jgi:hypothetical protein